MTSAVPSAFKRAIFGVDIVTDPFEIDPIEPAIIILPSCVMSTDWIAADADALNVRSGDPSVSLRRAIETEGTGSAAVLAANPGVKVANDPTMITLPSSC